ncbi:Natural resistance-associated macrophage protein [Phytophthora infestans]|uniref:Natural resistance-associated macrophage protein n=1 Tax=Phytophthora infestans TaxID=4787 RepID=A0A833WIP8_PHYIN|nr:Natural resistance-associated macrophage protein [Phytophthora infestans]KAF4150653.1 Natural resistance-associated macrophage protein [Phytophthora infestans]
MALFVSFLINAAVVCAFASSFFSSQCYALSSNPISSLYGRDIQTSCIPAKAALSSGSTIYDAFTGNVCVFGGESVFKGDMTADIINTVTKCTPCYVDGRGDRFDTVSFGLGPTAGYRQEIGLAQAGEAVREALGGYAKVVWAIGLLASGQASTMTDTYAGQFVMEGFLEIRIAAWKRVALTRGVALIPAILVALISQDRQFQSDRFNELLNVLQSVQLLFALLPLLAFTTSTRLMGPLFVNNRWIGALLVVGTALLCGVNYTLVYDILIKNLPEKLSTAAWIGLVVVAGLYMTLLLYLLLVYPSETVPSHYVVIPSAVDSEGLSEENCKSTDIAEERVPEDEGVV